uniref:Uncharacterized protein n=1 Tax=Setaria italica TaxID=4555 RepID=K4A400_SETIT
MVHGGNTNKGKVNMTFQGQGTTNSGAVLSDISTYAGINSKRSLKYWE